MSSSSQHSRPSASVHFSNPVSNSRIARHGQIFTKIGLPYLDLSSPYPEVKAELKVTDSEGQSDNRAENGPVKKQDNDDGKEDHANEEDCIDFEKLRNDVPSFKRYTFTTDDDDDNFRGNERETMLINRHKKRRKVTVNFKDSDAVRALACALLERDFGLKLLPAKDRLCPMVPGRYEYLLWILKVALITRVPWRGDVEAAPKFSKEGIQHCTPLLTGIDIGTGSSTIYPLLACNSKRLNIQSIFTTNTGSSEMRDAESQESPSPFNIRFIATEIDETSFSWAKKNLKENGIPQDQVLLIKKTGSKDDPIFPILKMNESSGSEEAWKDTTWIDFTMCNPPFYSSKAEIEALHESKVLDPFAVCTGHNVEMITEGGEVRFVSRMIEESVKLHRERGQGSYGIRWHSSLLGKFSSLSLIVDRLKSHDIDNYAVNELRIGKTKRWIIAWSFFDARLPDSLARFLSSPINRTKLLPLSNTHTYFCTIPPLLSAHKVPPSQLQTGQISQPRDAIGTVKDVLDQIFKELLIHFQWNTEPYSKNGEADSAAACECKMAAFRNTWARSARRIKNDKTRSPKRPRTDELLQHRDTDPQKRVTVGATLSLDYVRTISMAHTKQAGQHMPDGDKETQSQVKIVLEWTIGEDRAELTSLWAYIIKRVYKDIVHLQQ